MERRFSGHMKSPFRDSNLELLRIICMFFIIGDHFVGQSGIAEGGSILIQFYYCALTSLSRVACGVFIIISAFFSFDRSLKFRKVVHIWLTVIMYTIPISVWLYTSDMEEKNNLIRAFIPIESSWLWFAGYFIVLLLLSPALNLFITKAPRNVIAGFLTVMFCLQSLYTTVRTELGFFNNEIWSMIFLYVLTGFIKMYYSDKIPGKKQATVVFVVCWALLTLLRAIAAEHGLHLLSQYCETYRARYQTLPALIMEYSLFFAFLGIKIKPSRLINTLSSATLGVYCFHQVPIWHDFLWSKVLNAQYFSQTLHGGKRMLYTICCIFLVWLIGTGIELVRATLSGAMIEKRAFCRNACQKMDALFNASEEIISSDERKRLRKMVVLIVAFYFLVIQIFSLNLN